MNPALHPSLHAHTNSSVHTAPGCFNAELSIIGESYHQKPLRTVLLWPHLTIGPTSTVQILPLSFPSLQLTTMTRACSSDKHTIIDSADCAEDSRELAVINTEGPAECSRIQLIPLWQTCIPGYDTHCISQWMANKSKTHSTDTEAPLQELMITYVHE